MRYLSVCSGIEAASVAWRDLEMEPVAFSEIEPFPCALLAHHYPTVPNWGDMTKFKEWPDAAIDLLVGGTPCQAFSVAGLRQGLADPRGNLTLTFLAVAERYRPEWILWENVPGVLSIDAGRTFGSFLGGLGELGYGFAYRVLDAQYFGVAQRRRRVFVVAHARDWRRAAAVLFDGESVSGNPPPSRTAGERVTAGAPEGARGGGGVAELAKALRAATGGIDREDGHTLVPVGLAEVADPLRSGPPAGGPGHGKANGTDRATLVPYVPEFVSQAMSAKWSKGASGPAGDEVANLVATAIHGDVAHTIGAHRAGSVSEDGSGHGVPVVTVAPTLRAGGNRTGGDRPPGTDVDTCETLIPVVFKPSHFTRGKDGEPGELVPPLSADADKGDQDPLVLVPGFINPRQIRGSDWSNQVGIKPEAEVSDALCSDGPGAILAPTSFDWQAGAGGADTSFRGKSRAYIVDKPDQTRALTSCKTLAVAIPGAPLPFDTTQVTHPANHSNPRPGDPCHPLAKGGHAPAIAYDGKQVDSSDTSKGPPNLVQAVAAVRRLTPTECERLQGFPDRWTAVPYRGKPAADGVRYKALGNSMAVPVIGWLGRRLCDVGGEKE
jgi:DNA (cytosine-5)-methyltransferase 1